MNKKNKRRGLVALMLASAMVYSMVAGGFAGTQRFSDVPDFWGKKYIDQIVDGGLVSGYGNGKFGTFDTLNIDQLATIITAAKGHKVEKGAYWGEKRVLYCRDVLRCLPDFGDPTPANYSVPCTRELAIYMIETGLGMGGGKEANRRPNASYKDIPDFSQINVMYQDAVVQAYRDGIVSGIDKSGTFAPKQTLTRVEAATMLVQAGWTKAGTAPVTEKGMTNTQIYDAIKGMGIWEERTVGSLKTLHAKDPKYGAMYVQMPKDTALDDKLFIVLPETNDAADWKGDNCYDLQGNLLPMETRDDRYDAKTGKYVCSTAYGYTARQKLKEILNIALPTKGADAYKAVMNTFLHKTYEYGGDLSPSALRWYDGHSFVTGFMGENMQIVIGGLNNEAYYNKLKSKPMSGIHQDHLFKNGGLDFAIPAYELNKW